MTEAAGSPFRPPHGDVADEIADLRLRVESRLAELLPADPGGRDLVRRAMGDVATARGKRLRPLITMLAARDLGADPPAALDVGCAIEMLHAASLVLDDLPCMDDASMRRGRAAVHVEYGEDIAVLAAIGLVARAFGLAAAASRADANERVAIVGILADAIGVDGLVGGQYADLRGLAAPRGADVAVTIDRKTGALFVAAAESAAVLAGAGAEERTAVRTFARELGRAFQILDDLLDAEGDPADLGKDVGQDGGRWTMIAAIGPEAARRRMTQHVEAAVEALSALPSGGPRLRALVRRVFTETLGRVRDRIRARAGAGEALAAAGPGGV
jgi:geranylgeranyl diphosphate synthase type II